MSDKGQLVLVVESGPSQGHVFAIGDGAVIGRNAAAEIAVADKLISRQHGTFEVTNQRGIIVYSDHSHNGTFFQGVGASKPDFTLHNSPTVLREGDRLLMGRSVLRLSKRSHAGTSKAAASTSGDPAGSRWWHAAELPSSDDVGGNADPGHDGAAHRRHSHAGGSGASDADANPARVTPRGPVHRRGKPADARGHGDADSGGEGSKADLLSALSSAEDDDDYRESAPPAGTAAGVGAGGGRSGSPPSLALAPVAAAATHTAPAVDAGFAPLPDGDTAGNDSEDEWY